MERLSVVVGLVNQQTLGEFVSYRRLLDAVIAGKVPATMVNGR